MYILDTNYLTVIDRGGIEAQKLLERLRAAKSDQFVTTIINYEEQTKGCLSRIAKAKTEKRQVAAYNLFKQLAAYCNTPILDCDQKAAQEFNRLRKLYATKIGTMDLKIAAIALIHNAVVLTKNVRDFDPIENLSVENWL